MANLLFPSAHHGRLDWNVRWQLAMYLVSGHQVRSNRRRVSARAHLRMIKSLLSFLQATHLLRSSPGLRNTISVRRICSVPTVIVPLAAAITDSGRARTPDQVLMQQICSHALMSQSSPILPVILAPQFDGTSESYSGQLYQVGARPPVVESDNRHGMSPSALALQQHAPGQSLPQGLAAGYSRIHALPPPPAIPSPSASSVLAGSQGGFAPGTSFQQNQASFTDWIGLSPGKPTVHDHVRAGLSFDPSQRVPYPAATTSPGRPGGAPSPAVRTPSGKGWIAPTSPLSRPILTGDDEDLFVLDH